MANFLNVMRALGDESRMRTLRLLQQEELSVAELQEILSMGQSRISMQLSQLKQAGLVELRRSGQKSLYKLAIPAGMELLLRETIARSGDELQEASQDDEALKLILGKRKDKLRDYFDQLAGRFGRQYVPGRSWQGVAEMLMRLLPPLVIADLGAGEGTISLLLAQRAQQIIAVDSSHRMVEHGRDVAKRNEVQNFEYRTGDLEELPIADCQVDVALFHQSLHHAIHPQTAVNEAFRILKPGGCIIILDLVKHNFEEARELYAHVWLGFSRVELATMLQEARFHKPEIAVVHREEDTPHFETVMAIAEKCAGDCDKS